MHNLLIKYEWYILQTVFQIRSLCEDFHHIFSPSYDSTFRLILGKEGTLAGKFASDMKPHMAYPGQGCEQDLFVVLFMDHSSKICLNSFQQQCLVFCPGSINQTKTTLQEKRLSEFVAERHWVQDQRMWPHEYC